jgi:hypothetical protein
LDIHQTLPEDFWTLRTKLRLRSEAARVFLLNLSPPVIIDTAPHTITCFVVSSGWVRTTLVEYLAAD